ncbi:MAG: metal-responsive CopG/Arc/MetJ family transcriptional regulator [Halieaceae bacterium]|jgi:metal-responsive CopG/Arc/MetJ family transcriptional regulator
MKTAISIPDPIFESAERAAKKLGISRSELYATAVDEFVERYRVEDVTAQLDAVYSSSPSQLDTELQGMQTRSIDKEEW